MSENISMADNTFFFLFLHSSLIVKWGLHLTSTIMSFLVCYAAFKHNCLKKIYRGLFKLKFLISTKTKKHDLNILFPLTFHKLKMILVLNLLNKIRIKVEKKQNLGIWLKNSDSGLGWPLFHRKIKDSLYNNLLFGKNNFVKYNLIQINFQWVRVALM